MLREIDKPTPTPFGLVLKKGVEICSISLAAMPRPVSVTQISASCGAAGRAVTTIHRFLAVDAINRVHPVDDQVEQHLLQLHAVPQHLGEGDRPP